MLACRSSPRETLNVAEAGGNVGSFKGFDLDKNQESTTQVHRFLRGAVDNLLSAP